MSTLESVWSVFQIHDAGLVFTAIAGDPEAEFRRDSNAMHTRRVGDFTADLVLGKINHHHFGPVRDIEALRRRIHGQEIPAAVAADGNFLDEMIRPIGAADCHRQETQDAGQHRPGILFHICVCV